MERGGTGEGGLGKKRPAVPMPGTAKSGVTRPVQEGGVRGSPSQEKEVPRTNNSINLIQNFVKLFSF